MPIPVIALVTMAQIHNDERLLWLSNLCLKNYFLDWLPDEGGKKNKHKMSLRFKSSSFGTAQEDKDWGWDPMHKHFLQTVIHLITEPNAHSRYLYYQEGLQTETLHTSCCQMFRWTLVFRSSDQVRNLQPFCSVIAVEFSKSSHTLLHIISNNTDLWFRFSSLSLLLIAPQGTELSLRSCSLPSEPVSCSPLLRLVPCHPALSPALSPKAMRPCTPALGLAQIHS